MGVACSTNGGEEERVWVISGKVRGKETTRKTGKSEGKRPLGRPRHRWVDNIKMDLEEIGWGGVDWIGLV
jgi:hypothetical protein